MRGRRRISVATSVIRRDSRCPQGRSRSTEPPVTCELPRAGQVNPSAGADRSCCRSSPGVGIDRDDDGRSEPHSEAAASGDIRGEDWIGGYGDDRAGPLGIAGLICSAPSSRRARNSSSDSSCGLPDTSGVGGRRSSRCASHRLLRARKRHRAGDRRGAIEGTGGVAGGRVSITTERRPCRGGRNCRTWSSSPRAELASGFCGGRRRARRAEARRILHR